MRRLIALALVVALYACCALADTQVIPPPPGGTQPHQPRTLGQKAVLHIYYYAPKTLEITYVDSYFYKDEAECKEKIGMAVQIAAPYAGDGDLVSAKCVGIEPPAAITDPEKKAKPAKGETEL